MDDTPLEQYQLTKLLSRGATGERWRVFDTATGQVLADMWSARLGPQVSVRRIEGKNLRLVLESGPLEPFRAVGIIEQIASALEAAHTVGIVHRDVAPSNILVTEKGVAYLIDFGFGRAAGGTVTTSGSGAYTAPELFAGDDANARSDIYSLACVLYECLTGSPPFPGTSLEQQIKDHLMTPPPRPSTLGVPIGFDDVIARGMAKDPGERYATALDLATEARAALTTAEPNVRPPRGVRGAREPVTSRDTLLKRQPLRERREKEIAETAAETSWLRRRLKEYQEELPHDGRGVVSARASYQSHLRPVVRSSDSQMTWVTALAVASVLFSLVASSVPGNSAWIFGLIVGLASGVGTAFLIVAAVALRRRRGSSEPKGSRYSKKFPD